MFLGLWAGLASLPAAQELKEAKVTEIVRLVEKEQSGTKTQMVLKDTIDEKSTVDTGTSSMAELTFADTSITRLGENSVFSFNSKERLVKLDKGSCLMHTPPGNGGVSADLGGGVTASVTGTTIMLAKTPNGAVAFLVMEGSVGKIVTKDGKITEIHPGEVGSIPAGSSEVKVSVVNVDFIKDHAPLFQEFSSVLPGTEGIQGVSDLQAMQIQMEMSILMAPTEAGLSDDHGAILAQFFRFNIDQVNAAKNLILTEPDTSSGGEEGSGNGTNVTDARQGGAEAVATAAGGDTATSTASTDTAAGGNVSPDTQPPPPINQPANPASATPF